MSNFDEKFKNKIKIQALQKSNMNQRPPGQCQKFKRSENPCVKAWINIDFQIRKGKKSKQLSNQWKHVKF